MINPKLRSQFYINNYLTIPNMSTESANFNKKLYETIHEALPKDLKILFISLTGSRGKNMASSESDYDVKVIILNPHDKYLLQKPIKTREFNVKFEGKSLEGTAKDILVAFEYALETNPFILEALRGIPVYIENEDVLRTLKNVFIEGYMPTVPISAFMGMIGNNTERLLKGKDKLYLEKAPVKVVMERVYELLQLRCLFEGKDIMDYLDVDKLMEFAGKEETFIKDLLRKRRDNRKDEVAITEEFKEMLENMLRKAKKFKEEFPEVKEEVKQRRENLKEKVDKACFEIIQSNLGK